MFKFSERRWMNKNWWTLMETKVPKLRVEVAAIPIQYSTIPINIFNGKVETGLKIQIKANRSIPYPISLNEKSSAASKKSCTNCINKQIRNLTTSDEQISSDLPVSNMYNSPVLILPFVAAKPASQFQRKALATVHSQPSSLFHQHAKNLEDTNRVIKNLLPFP